MGMWSRAGAVTSISGAAMALLAVLVATPARADTAEDNFIAHIKHSNEVATSIPGTPDRWVLAGHEICGRISQRTAQGERLQAAINNEVIATGVFYKVNRQDSVALVTYAFLDLCPNLAPPR